MCTYCEGKEKARKDLIDSKYTDFYISEDNKLVFAKTITADHINYTVSAEVDINFCPMCGRNLIMHETEVDRMHKINLLLQTTRVIDIENIYQTSELVLDKLEYRDDLDIIYPVFIEKEREI
jgi:hypothetical protein